MLGYNVEQINTLLNSIAESYGNIQKAMEEPWPALSSAMRKEWVGPDEIANEKTLAGALSKLYGVCSEAIGKLQDNIAELGGTWKQFQGGNTLENGETANVGLVKDIKYLSITSHELNLPVPEEDFAAGTDLGLTNGASSATTLTTAIDEYAKAVFKSVEGLYGQLDANKAFLGEDQAVKITQYLHDIGTSIAHVTVCFKKLKDAIVAAAEAYVAQASTTAESVSSQDTEFDVGDQSVI